MAQTVYTAKGLIGGGADDLDLIDGASLLDGDLAFVFYGDKSYYYQLDDDSDLTEDSPWIITPNTNAGNKRWILKQGHVSERKNAIINGNFNIWQRGTTFTGIADGDYSADRFIYNKNGTMIHDIIRSTDVPTSENFNYSAKIDCTTADVDIDAANYVIFTQRIEGYNFLPFVGKTATLSFWVKATKTGTYCISFVNSGFDRSYIAEYTINSADTWEKKEITLTFDYSGGTWDFTNGIGIRIRWALACGSTYHTTADTWQTGNYLATSNQVNACDSVDNNFWLTGIQFELGGVATDFENRLFNQELTMCQRYYEKSYDYTVAPGTTNDNGSIIEKETRNQANGTGGTRFLRHKRATPTITLYATVTGNSGKVTNNGDKTAGAANIGEKGIGQVTITSGDLNYDAYYHYVADAEL